MANYHFEAIGDTSGVLTAIANAVTGAGWTVEHNGVDGGSGDPANTDYRRHVLVISSGSQTFGFAFDSLSGHVMRLYSLGTYLPAEALEDQADLYLYGNYYRCAGGVCHVFYDSTYVYGIVESATDSFRHFGCGMLIKNDTYLGGQFITTHRTNTSYGYHDRPFQYEANTYYENVDSFAMSWGGDGHPVNWHYNRSDRLFPDKCRGGVGSDNALTHNLVVAGSTQFNRQSVLVPIYCDVLRAGDAFYSPVGYPPDVREVNISYLNDKQTITLGGDEWMVFPVGERNSASGGFSSGITGLAYLASQV